MKTVALVMVVGNHRNVIKRCLNSVKQHVSTWFIYDYGSYDGTDEFIREYFDQCGIQGHLLRQNFGNTWHNLNKPLSIAYNKTDYVLLMNPNCELEGDIPELTSDVYENDGVVLLNNHIKWLCIDENHVCSSRNDLQVEKVKCNNGVSLQLGNLDNPSHVFSLAQHFKQMGMFKDALNWYDTRVQMKDDTEEHYYAMYQKGLIMCHFNDKLTDEIVELLIQAYEKYPRRLETMYHLVRSFRLDGKYEEGFKYGIRAFGSEVAMEGLYLDTNVHQYAFWDELALCAYYVRQYELAKIIYDRLFRENRFPAHNMDKYKKNYEFFVNAVNKLSTITETSKCFFFVYHGFYLQSGGTYVTLKSYIDYFKSCGDRVYIFNNIPTDDDIKKYKPDCIITAQHATFNIQPKLSSWSVPSVALTFAPGQYPQGDYDYPSAVTYSNYFIKQRCPYHPNDYIVRDPVNHKLYEISPENCHPEYITLIGSPPNVKRHDIFFTLAERFPDENFMIVSEQQYPSEGNVVSYPYIRNLEELKEKVYSRCKLLLLPSAYEAFGRVTIEATASNIPCIISNYPGLSGATFDMSNYVDDHGNVEAWVEKLDHALKNYDDYVYRAKLLHEKLDYQRDVTTFRDIVLRTSGELDPGLSFLIRAKNEKDNIVGCLKTLTKITDQLDNVEIIVVDNNSTDNTYQMVVNFAKNNSTVKVYRYPFEVCKIGDNDNRENKSIATFYNWCLSKTTKCNVFKWDADFIAHGDNLLQMIQEFNLIKREDNFSLWCTGETVFIDGERYYKKKNSYYDEYRVFSKKNGFKWKDHGHICETAVESGERLRFEQEVFFEVKNTCVDEFSTRAMLLDRRDRDDFNTLNNLRDGKDNNLLDEFAEFGEFLK